MRGTMKNCHQDHDLEVIAFTSYGNDTQEVVRWCLNCGAVVVDSQVGGQTLPGRFMKMKLPTISREAFIKDLEKELKLTK